ncbi:IS66 family transposase [Photorhabdus laumondii]
MRRPISRCWKPSCHACISRKTRPCLILNVNLCRRHYPVEDIRLAPETESCPDCCHALRFLRDEISERLEYRPATFIVQRYVCPQYSCVACQSVHAQAQPARLIEKGVPEPGLLAQVVVAKYRDHLPLYREQSIYARSGVTLARNTLSDWMGQVALALQPLADALKQTLLMSPVLHADETPLPILAPGKGQTQRAYLWTYATGPDTSPTVVYYELHPGRSGRYAQGFLEGWAGGYLVCKRPVISPCSSSPAHARYCFLIFTWRLTP